jgi:phosphoribosylformylglycinamidine synthase
MKSAVVVFPGSNRDRDMRVALETVTGEKAAAVWHTETTLPRVDLVVLPGGFSYGDYLRSGAIAARAPVMAAIADHAARGGLVLGVCNGFQILCEAGLLPGVLMRNAGLKFICREVHLRVETTDTPFTRRYAKGQVIRTPVAHGDGNYRCDDETLARLKGENRVAFRYVDAAGNATAEANPNGSLDSIAGILSDTRNVLGLMPHPENLIEPLQGGTDGRALFEGLAA